MKKLSKGNIFHIYKSVLIFKEKIEIIDDKIVLISPTYNSHFPPKKICVIDGKDWSWQPVQWYDDLKRESY